MIRQTFMCLLDFGFSRVFLETKIGMLFEPPRSDLSFTDPTEYGKRRRVISRTIVAKFGKRCEMICQNLGPKA